MYSRSSLIELCDYELLVTRNASASACLLSFCFYRHYLHTRYGFLALLFRSIHCLCEVVSMVGEWMYVENNIITTMPNGTLFLVCGELGSGELNADGPWMVSHAVPSLTLRYLCQFCNWPKSIRNSSTPKSWRSPMFAAHSSSRFMDSLFHQMLNRVRGHIHKRLFKCVFM